MNAPCKGCTDRYLMCHSNCEKYKQYKLENERVKDIISTANYEDSYFVLGRKRSLKLVGR